MTAAPIVETDDPRVVERRRQEAAAELLDGLTSTETAAVILAELWRLHERVDAFEQLATTFAELGSKGLGGMLGSLLGRSG